MIKMEAPAKVNLFLAVGRLLPSGLHEITSVMQTIDLVDELSCYPADEIEVNCNLSELVGAENLVYRAAALLKGRFDVPAGVKINLFKRIPIASGLGGGSSDAAAALLALNKLWRLKLSSNDLAALAADLGADVPFFLQGGTQLVQGFGQILTPLEGGTLKSVRFVLANPGRRLSAAAVYSRFDKLPRREGPSSAEGILTALADDDINAVFNSMTNELEDAATALCKEIRELKQTALKNGASIAMISGSGPTVVALADSDVKARSIFKALRSQASFVTINRAVWPPLEARN